MSHPSALVADRVRSRLRAEGIDPSIDPEAASRITHAEVRRHDDLALARGEALIDDEAACVREVMASLSGFGALQPLLDDPEIEEIWLNGSGHVHIAREGEAERTGLRLDDVAVRDIVERMLQSTGRRVDISQPFVDASLPDGSRLHVAIADVVRGSWAVNIRKFLPKYRSLDALAAQGMMPTDVAELLTTAMNDGRSVIVSGATHAGKAKPAITPHFDLGFVCICAISAPRFRRSSLLMCQTPPALLSWPPAGCGTPVSRLRLCGRLGLTHRVRTGRATSVAPRRYPRGMLAFLGALIPVLASLYVGIGTLIDLSTQSHKARAARRVWAQYEKECAAVQDGDPRVEEKFREYGERRMRLLEVNGLDPMIGTINALSESQMPAAPSKKEFHRQWVLIFGAVAGVILVGIEVGLISLA